MAKVAPVTVVITSEHPLTCEKAANEEGRDRPSPAPAHPVCPVVTPTGGRPGTRGRAGRERSRVRGVDL
ncbi:hypothetical protein GCM10017688_44550 [Streptomyces ramulosus]